jgi:hypothetical protein
MRLVDFLVLLLEAHAETLKRLAALFGEDRFLEMLENTGADLDDEPAIPEIDSKDIPFSPTGSSGSSNMRSPYVALEGAVRDFDLPAVLEFHLWAYPFYRSIIESDLDLSSALTPDSVKNATSLVDRAIQEAKTWVHKLPIPPVMSAQAEAAAQVPWIRFRTTAFRKMGLRPMGAVL